MRSLDSSRRRAEIFLGIFSIDPALNGVSLDPDILLSDLKRHSGSDLQLLLYKIDTCYPLCHRMLHLDPCIHFHKPEFSIRFQKKFDRSRIYITGCFRRRHRRMPHFFS